MKLKPIVYKNILDKTKKDIKFNFEHEKTRRELMEENLEEIKKKSIIEYLEILNEKTKEKLIGLCLDKKILDSFENDEYIWLKIQKKQKIIQILWMILMKKVVQWKIKENKVNNLNLNLNF